MSTSRATHSFFSLLKPALTVASVLALSVAAACGEARANPETAAKGASGNVQSATTAGSSGAAAAPIPNAFTLADSLLVARADKGRVMGKETSAIWVVMISDFQCPYCKQWHDESMESFKRDYVNTGKVKFAYLHLPLPNHPFARAQAEATMCASVHDRFWQYADQLFQRQKEISRLPAVQPALMSIAAKLKIDSTEFAQCQQKSAIHSLVESDIQQANTARIQSTPSFLVGDFLVQGALPYPDFRRAIDTALAVARASQRPR